MITIVTKTYCPFCSSAKQFLDALDVEYREVEVSNDQDTYDRYKEISGMTSVPQIFNWEPSKETLIWGCDDMMAKYEAGEIFQ